MQWGAGADRRRSSDAIWKKPLKWNAEAERLGVNDGALISLTVAGQALRLPVKVSEDLALGLVGLPVGFAGIPAAIAGATATGLQEAAQ